MVRDVSKFLRNKEAGASADPALAGEWAKMDDLYSKRLWHQLTLQLSEFVKRPVLQSNNQLIELHENFIQDIEMRINPLALMEMLALIVEQFTDADQALEFLNKNEPKLKGNDTALGLCLITKGEIVLTQKKDIRLTKNILEEAEKILARVDGVSAAHGRFYLLQSRLYDTVDDTALYYKSALKFLGCTKQADLSIAEQKKHAKNLSIAALVGDGIYNFGELLAHPVLDSLKRTGDEWLVSFMKAFNAGDIGAYEGLKKQWQNEPTLKKHEKSLRTKILLLCLMEMTFKRPATERQLSFEEIAQTTQLKEDQVEELVMKAIAKGLVDGAIDEISKKVHMTWVQPRVLDRNQIGTMISRLDDWKKEINLVEKLMEDNAEDILLV